MQLNEACGLIEQYQSILTLIVWENRKESRLVQKHHQCITKNKKNERKPISGVGMCMYIPSPKTIYFILDKRNKRGYHNLEMVLRGVSLKFSPLKFNHILFM